MEEISMKLLMHILVQLIDTRMACHFISLVLNFF
jgi:hypothetical protein